MEKEANNPAEFISGTGKINLISKNSTTRIYNIITDSNNARIKENTLYFPNWEVKVNGKKTGIEFQDPAYRGLMTYFIPKGKNTVEIKFRDTKLRYVSNSISAVSIILLGIILIHPFLLRKK